MRRVTCSKFRTSLSLLQMWIQKCLLNMCRHIYLGLQLRSRATEPMWTYVLAWQAKFNSKFWTEGAKLILIRLHTNTSSVPFLCNIYSHLDSIWKLVTLRKIQIDYIPYIRESQNTVSSPPNRPLGNWFSQICHFDVESLLRNRWLPWLTTLINQKISHRLWQDLMRIVPKLTHFDRSFNGALICLILINHTENVSCLLLDHELVWRVNNST